MIEKNEKVLNNEKIVDSTTDKLKVKKVVKPRPKKNPRDKLFKLDRKPFILSSSPHLNATDSVPKIMWMVVLALIPTSATSVYYFGMSSVIIILACIISALLTEFIINKIKKVKSTLFDGSAMITGLLLALTLPPSFPITSAILGSIFAIAIGKHIFGGLGFNIFNPALIGRAFLQASFPVAITTWTLPSTEKYINATSSATPLGLFKFESQLTEIWEMITGNIGGSLGETSAIAILIGGIFLIIKRYADWRIPTSFISSVIIFSGIFWLINPDQFASPLFHVFSGGLMIGAFFMATDMVTSPITSKGAWIFGFGAGFLLVIIRLFGGLPEGVMYSILLMNAVTPLINRYTRPQFFGEIK